MNEGFFAFQNGDPNALASALAVLDPDIEWHGTVGGLDEDQVAHGYEELARSICRELRSLGEAGARNGSVTSTLEKRRRVLARVARSRHSEQEIGDEHGCGLRSPRRQGRGGAGYRSERKPSKPPACRSRRCRRRTWRSRALARSGRPRSRERRVRRRGRDSQAGRTLGPGDRVGCLRRFPVLDISGVYRGADAARNWWREWYAAWDTLRFEYELFERATAWCCCLDLALRGRSTGIEFPPAKARGSLRSGTG